MVMDGAAVKPRLCQYPEGGFGVTVLLINLMPWVDWKHFILPCASLCLGACPRCAINQPDYMGCSILLLN